MIGAYHALAGTLYFIGDFETARRYAEHGVHLWRAGGVQSHAEEVFAPIVACLFYGALSEWHLGQIASCKAIMARAISLAKEPHDTYTLAVALWHAAVLGHLERNPAGVERLASDLIELSTRQTFAFCLSGGKVLRGMGAQRFRQYSGRYRLDRGRNPRLSGNRLDAAPALFSRSKGRSFALWGLYLRGA
jgi:hypothetical protein